MNAYIIKINQRIVHNDCHHLIFAYHFLELPMNKTIIQASLVTLLIMFPVAHAEINNQYSLSTKAGALSTGFDITYDINDKLNARFSVNNRLLHTSDYEADDDVYNDSYQPLGSGGMVDYHPFMSNFRLSAGLLSQDNGLDADALDNGRASIGGKTYRLGDINLNQLSPYLGLGWQDAAKKDKQWHFSLDAGVLFQGRSKTKVSSSTVSPVLVAINNEPQNDHHNIDQALPMISLETSYRF